MNIDVFYVAIIVNCGEFNNASAFKRSLYWCQALHITNKDRYQSTSARRALALLNLPLDLVCGRISEFCEFPQDIRALPDAQAAMEPAGDISGGLQE